MTDAERDAFRAELLTRLFYLHGDCELVMETIRRDGPEHTNIDLFEGHLERYRAIVARMKEG